MANNLRVTKACSILVNGTGISFNVGDIVVPTNAFYQVLLQSGNAVDTGSTAGTGQTSPSTTNTPLIVAKPVSTQLDIAHQIARFNSSTGLFEMIPLEIEYARAEDNSGATALQTTMGTVSAKMNAAMCVVAFPTKRNMRVHYTVDYQVTAAGNGTLFVTLAETTSGASVSLQTTTEPGGFFAGSGSQFGSLPGGSFELGPIQTTRVFNLFVGKILDASSLLAANTRNNTLGKSSIWLEAA